MPIDENKNQEPMDKESPLRAIGAFVWDLFKILVVALIIIVPFRMFIAEPFVVSGHSMLPNYHDRDYLIIDRLTYHRSEPQRGDVIVLKFPKDPSQFFIKRIIGLPGESVKISGGFVTIYNPSHSDGVRLEEAYLPKTLETFGPTEIVKLGTDEYFVLGDNRTASSDSRVWGKLPKGNIIGKVWVRVFPVSKSEFFKKPSYNL
jgi:signal peptidase I